MELLRKPGFFFLVIFLMSFRASESSVSSHQKKERMIKSYLLLKSPGPEVTPSHPLISHC